MDISQIPSPGLSGPHLSAAGIRGRHTLSQLGLGFRLLHPGAHCSVLLGMASVEAQKLAMGSVSIMSEVCQTPAGLPLLQTQEHKWAGSQGGAESFPVRNLSFFLGESRFMYYSVAWVRGSQHYVVLSIWYSSGFPWRCEEQWIGT